MVSNRNLLFQGFIFRFHVKFQGCTFFKKNMSPNGWLVWVGGWGFLEQSTTNQVRTMNQQVDFKTSHSLQLFKTKALLPKIFGAKEFTTLNLTKSSDGWIRKTPWKINIDEFILTFKPNKNYPKHPPSHFFDPYVCFNNQNKQTQHVAKSCPQKKKHRQQRGSLMSICNRQLQWTQALDLFQEVRELTPNVEKTTWAMEKGTYWLFIGYI